MLRGFRSVGDEAERERGEEECHHAAPDVLEAQTQQERVVDVEVRAVGVDQRAAPDKEPRDGRGGADDDPAALP